MKIYAYLCEDIYVLKRRSNEDKELVRVGSHLLLYYGESETLMSESTLMALFSLDVLNH